MRNYLSNFKVIMRLFHSSLSAQLEARRIGPLALFKRLSEERYHWQKAGTRMRQRASWLTYLTRSKTEVISAQNRVHLKFFAY